MSEELKYKPEGSIATIAIAGFDKNAKFFRDFISSQEEFKRLGMIESPPEINGKKVINEEILNSLPIAAYRSEEEGIEIVNYNFDKKLNIKKINFEAADKDIIIRIFKLLLEDNYKKIQQIGFNFTTNFIGKNKLKLLNPEIEDINDWDKNITFILTIPFEYHNHTATYKIQQLLSSCESKNEFRAYQISTNLNFDIEKYDGVDNTTKVNDLLCKFDDYNEEFQKKCKEFLGLYYE